jgi:hypothetical protein
MLSRNLLITNLVNRRAAIDGELATSGLTPAFGAAFPYPWLRGKVLDPAEFLSK